MKALAFSGGKDSMACLHLMRDLDCAIYVNTGYAYPETLAMVEFAKTMLPVHIVCSDRKGQNEVEGIPADVVPIDWTRLGQLVTGAKPVIVQSYLDCCLSNVVVPLYRRARELGVTHIVFGQRNDEGHKSPSRNGDVVNGITRLHPIENWTDAEVFSYLATKMEVPEHFGIKHSSLDCYDCTAYRKDSQDRVAWTRERYPAFWGAHETRRAALDSAMRESI